LCSTLETVFTADFRHGNNRQRLRRDRYDGILSGAYHRRHDLELGVAMWGVTTDAEAKPSGDLQSCGVERGFSDPYCAQDIVYGNGLLTGGQAGPIGMHANFGYFRTDGHEVENFLVISSPVHIASRSLSDGERLRSVLDLNFQPGPQTNLSAQGLGDTSTCHPSLPPPPSPAADRRTECLILQSVHFELETSRLTPFGRRVLDDATYPLRALPSFRMESEGHADSSGTKWSILKLGKRRAAVVKGYLALWHRSNPQRMTTLDDGEVRPIAEKRTREGQTLNRRVECGM
jgi:outer membrane protein OmpA-like peptidoglycan-associated protein